MIQRSAMEALNLGPPPSEPVGPPASQCTEKGPDADSETNKVPSTDLEMLLDFWLTLDRQWIMLDGWEEASLTPPPASRRAENRGSRPVTERITEEAMVLFHLADWLADEPKYLPKAILHAPGVMEDLIDQHVCDDLRTYMSGHGSTFGDFATALLSFAISRRHSMATGQAGDDTQRGVLDIL
jgi:hypothetical protein